MTTGSASPFRDAGRLGDEAAGARVAQLFRDHGRLVLGLCRLLLRDAADAEDAAQATFLSAYRSLLKGTEPRDSARWLAAIARNECRARVRARMREPLAEAGGGDDSADPVARAIANADFSALRQALRELPRRQRRAFVLRELSGLTYGELAIALGVTEPAIESLLFRARRQLRARLGRVLGTFTTPFGLRDALSLKIATAAAGTALVAGGAVAVEHGRISHRDVVRDQRPPARVRQIDRPERSVPVARIVAPAAAPAPRVRRPAAAHAERHESEARESVKREHDPAKAEHERAAPDGEPEGADAETEAPAPDAETETADTETTLQDEEPTSEDSGGDSGAESDSSDSDSTDG